MNSTSNLYECCLYVRLTLQKWLLRNVAGGFSSGFSHARLTSLPMIWSVEYITQF